MGVSLMPRGVYERVSRPTEERFAEKVLATESGCWEWLGYRQPNGYGRFGVGKGDIRFAQDGGHGYCDDETFWRNWRAAGTPGAMRP
jgi:hypothetical protein